VWNLRRLAPESFRPASISTIAAALLLGAAACGPSNGGGNPATYIIVFTLAETEGDDDLTSLEFNVEYEVGNFTGTGTDVACSLADVGDTAVFDDDNAGNLKITIDATDDELVEGDDIVECELVSTVQPTTEDFTIEVTDAEPSDPGDVEVIVTSTDPEGAAASSDETGEIEE
jgi:hypothetical protein